MARQPRSSKALTSNQRDLPERELYLLVQTTSSPLRLLSQFFSRATNYFFETGSDAAPGFFVRSTMAIMGHVARTSGSVLTEKCRLTVLSCRIKQLHHRRRGQPFATTVQDGCALYFGMLRVSPAIGDTWRWTPEAARKKARCPVRCLAAEVASISTTPAAIDLGLSVSVLRGPPVAHSASNQPRILTLVRGRPSRSRSLSGALLLPAAPGWS
jgi:hypothetical protein